MGRSQADVVATAVVAALACGAAAIGAFVNPAAKSGYIKHAGINRADWIEQDMSGSRWIHAGIRLGPGFSTII